jgi:hypothetical protein
MELIEGITLKQYMEQKGPAQLAGSAALHATQIARRSPTPTAAASSTGTSSRRTSWCCKDGSVKVADFGIAAWKRSSPRP